METALLLQLTTLGHPGRMAVFRLLMRHYPGAVSAGNLAAATGFKASTLSVYLSALTSAELISQQRVGTSRLYRVRMDAVQGLQDYLFRDCCRGRPELCPPFSAGESPIETAAYKVLFICSGNSARSIFAEALLRDLGLGRFLATSAGTAPRAAINPRAADVLQANGHDTSALHPSPVTSVRGDRFDFVFTVCDRAANEECPPWPGLPISAHWGLPDPSRAEDPAAFERTYQALKDRIARFVALPIDTLDAVSLQAAVDDLAKETS